MFQVQTGDNQAKVVEDSEYNISRRGIERRMKDKADSSDFKDKRESRIIGVYADFSRV